MKNIWKYILIGLIVVIIQWFFLALMHDFFNGLSNEGALIAGVGFFLAFELTICTGLILSKLNIKKQIQILRKILVKIA